MKKLAVVFIALVLVCTSAFAAFSFTAGSGFGMNISLDDSGAYDMGATGFFGVDFILANRLSFYNDVEFNLAMRTQAGKIENLEGSCPVLFDKSGVGVTLGGEKFNIMFGVGPEFQMFTDPENICFRFGANARIKTTFFYSEHCGITFQVTPACEILSLELDRNESATLSASALLGVSVKY